MKKAEVNKLLAKLLCYYDIWAPVKKGETIVIAKIGETQNRAPLIGEIDWSGKIPANSFKPVFLPVDEELAQVNGNKQTIKFDNRKQIAWNMNILDLQAFSLLEQVFEKDIYYQKRRRNTYAVGFTNGLEADLREYKAFHLQSEENILEHLIFDVFIERKKDGQFVFFSGSEKGQQLLENNGIKDYEHIEFAGLVPEQGPNPVIAERRKAVEENARHSCWQELAKICLSCGKCSLVCPTCFCFDQQDEPQFFGVKKIRQWTSCFYPEFSKIAGEHKELGSVAKRIYYWYFHKFVRIPDQFTYYGCVGCGRCIESCPVGINIKDNLKRLL